MVFNSLEFAIFLPVVFILYWVIFRGSARWQNMFLLMSSLVFYIWADWRFVFLLIFSTLTNYYLGLRIAGTTREKSRLLLLWTGIILNLGILGYFKYFNFFYDGFIDLFNVFGLQLNHSSLKIVLPLGISFYTFQTLGYIIDVYNEDNEPCKDLLVFSTYVIYFPKILAGPIERSQKFIPQIEVERTFDFKLAEDGMRQILWGLFAKIVIADRSALIVNDIFGTYTTQTGSMLFMASALYLVQIYADFSGYSNIAIGVSKLFGIRLMTNFALPFFSTNISELWKKWHISLTTWLMDYVFTPLSFSLRKYRKAGLIISIVITFILVGFWHGANWTFIVFGLLQGFYFIPMIVRGTLNKSAIIAPNKHLPSISEFIKMTGLFILMALTAVFFRADNVGQAFHFIANIFSPSFLIMPDFKMVMYILPVIILFMLAEWFTRTKVHALEFTGTRRIVRWSVYVILGFVVLLAYDNNPNAFIYLQF